MFIVEPLGTLGVDAVGLVKMALGGILGVECDVEVDPFTAIDREQGLFFARFGPDVGGAGIVGGVGHIGEYTTASPAAA